MKKNIMIISAKFFVWMLIFYFMHPVKAQADMFISDTTGSIRLYANFPGGSMEIQNIDYEKNIVRIRPSQNAERGWVCWWYFRVEGLKPGEELTIEVESGGFGLPEKAQFSYDNKIWTHTESGDRRSSKLIVYHHKAKAPTIWFAWGPPFLLNDANELINKISNSGYGKKFELAKTLNGRSVPAAVVSEKGVDEKDRNVIWIQARQHAWESGGSWVGQGFIEWLISGDPLAKELRQKTLVYFVPIMDVDNVEDGFGGKNQKPHDHYWDWSTFPYFPEVNAAISIISGYAAANRFQLFIDLHNPAPSNREVFFYVPAKPLLVPVRLKIQEEFFEIAKKEITGPTAFVGKLGPIGETWDPVKEPGSDCWIANNTNPGVLSLTMETPWNVTEGTQKGYMKTGEQLGRTIALYFKKFVAVIKE